VDYLLRPWEVNSSSASLETPELLSNPNVHHRIHKNPPPVPILCHINPFHVFPSHLMKISFNIILPCMVDRDSSVGIATRYGLDGPGIESRWGRDFRTCPDRPRGPPSLLYNGYRFSFPGGKQPGRWPPTPSSAEVKERVQLYLCSPSGPSWPVLGLTLPLHFTSHLCVGLPSILFHSGFPTKTL
jgi:hypothetical protein